MASDPDTYLHFLEIKENSLHLYPATESLVGNYTVPIMIKQDCEFNLETQTTIKVQVVRFYEDDNSEEENEDYPENSGFSSLIESDNPEDFDDFEHFISQNYIDYAENSETLQAFIYKIDPY